MKKLIYFFIVIIAYIGICRIAEDVLISMLDLTNENTLKMLMTYEFFTFSSVVVVILLIVSMIHLDSYKEIFDEEIFYGCGAYIIGTTFVFSLLYSFFPSVIVIILYNLFNIGILIFWTNLCTS